MRGSIEGFIRRLFTPRMAAATFQEGAPLGRELPAEWRFQVEYGLAELGFGLRRDVALRGLRDTRGEPAGRVFFQNGILFVTGGAAKDGRLTEACLHLDLPHALIDRPRCWRE